MDKFLEEIGATAVTPSLPDPTDFGATPASVEKEPESIEIKGSEARLQDELEKLGATWVPEKDSDDVESGFKQIYGILQQGPQAIGSTSFFEWKGRDDGPTLGEAVESRAKLGWWTVNRSRAIAPGLYGKEDPEVTLAKMELWDSRAPEDLSPDFKWTDPNSVVANTFGTVAELEPYMFESAKAAVKYGSGGALAGAGVGTIIPGVGTVLGAKTGWKLGSSLGIIKTSMDIEGAGIYGDLLREGVEPQNARTTALAAGLAIGLIEKFQLGILGKRFIGASKPALRKAAVRAFSKNPVLKETLAGIAKKLSGDVTKETLQEVSQEIIGLGSQHAVKVYEEAKYDKDFKNMPGFKEYIDTALQTAIQTAPAFGILSLPGVSFQSMRSAGSRQARYTSAQRKRTRQALNRAARVVDAEIKAEGSSAKEVSRDAVQVQKEAQKEEAQVTPEVYQENAEDAARLASQVFEGSVVELNLAGDDLDATLESDLAEAEEEINLPEGVTPEDLARSQNFFGVVASETLQKKNMFAAIRIRNEEGELVVIHAEKSTGDGQNHNHAVEQAAKKMSEELGISELDASSKIYDSVESDGFVDDKGNYYKREDLNLIAELAAEKEKAESREEKPSQEQERLIEDHKTLKELGAIPVKEETTKGQKPKKAKKPTKLERQALGLPEPTEIVMDEQRALKIKLQAEARAAKYGYKAGAADMKARLVEFFQGKIQSIKNMSKEAVAEARRKVSEIRSSEKEIRHALVEYIKQALPVSESGRMIDRVKNASNMLQLIRAFQATDRVHERYKKRQIIEKLRSKLNSLIRSRVVAIDVKGSIMDLVNSLDLKSTSDKIRQRLRSTRDFIKSETAAGRDVTMPAHVLRSLEILDKRPVNTLSLTELELIFDEILFMEKLGKVKLALLRERKNAKTREIQAEIDSSKSGPIDVKELEVPVPGSGAKLIVQARFRNFFRSIANAAQAMDLAVSPMDVIFDLLDGSQNYMGALFKNFKKRTDLNFNRFLDRAGRLRDEVWKTAKNLDLGTTNFERIGIYAADQQESGRERLKNTGLSDQYVESIKLTPEEKLLYDYMRDKLDEVRPDLEKFAREVLNVDMGKVDNYFSFMTDWDSMSESEVWERVSGSARKIGEGRLLKTPARKFMQRRTGPGKQKIKLNAMEIFTRHMDNAIYLLEMGEDNSVLVDVARSPKFAEKYGQRGQAMVRSWLDLIARKGGVAGDMQIAWLDALRRNVGAATLGLKLSSALIQPTALLDGASFIGRWAFIGARAVASNRDWRDFLMENFPKLRERTADDPSFREFSDNRTLSEIQEKGYWLLKELDAVTAGSVVAGAYMQYLESVGEDLDFGKPNPDAVAYAQHILNRTQASAFFPDLPPIIGQGRFSEKFSSKTLGKLIFQFQTFVLNRWSVIRHDMIRNGIQARDFKKAGNIFMYMTLANLAEYGIRRASRELIDRITGADPGDEDEEWWNEVALTLVGNVPFVSQAVSFIGYGNVPVPSLAILGRAAEKARKRIAGKKPETRARGLINLVESGATFAGIPGAMQLGSVADDFFAANTESGKLSYSSRALSRFRREATKARATKERYEFIARKHGAEKANEFLAHGNNSKYFSMNKVSNKSSSAISKLRQAKRAVLYDKTLSRQKRARLMAELNDSMDEIAQSSVEAFSSILSS